MNNTELPKVGEKIIVHNPDTISHGERKIKCGDVAKVVGHITSSTRRILAYNPEWDNNEYGKDYFTYHGPCVILWSKEYEVVP